MSQTATVHPIDRGINPPTVPTEKTDTKKKPTKILPTSRMPLERQLHLLRAYANAFEHYNKPLTTVDVSKVAKIPNTTISTANQFLLDIGLIEKSDGGFIPSSSVIASEVRS